MTDTKLVLLSCSTIASVYHSIWHSNVYLVQKLWVSLQAILIVILWLSPLERIIAVVLAESKLTKVSCLASRWSICLVVVKLRCLWLWQGLSLSIRSLVWRGISIIWDGVTNTSAYICAVATLWWLLWPWIRLVVFKLLEIASSLSTYVKHRLANSRWWVASGIKLVITIR